MVVKSLRAGCVDCPWKGQLSGKVCQFLLATCLHRELSESVGAQHDCTCRGLFCLVERSVSAAVSVYGDSQLLCRAYGCHMDFSTPSRWFAV